MAEIELQEFLDEVYRKEFLESNWAGPEVKKILNDYGITQNIGNLLLGMKNDEDSVMLTFISNGDLFVYTVFLGQYYQYFKVLRNVKSIDVLAYKNYNILDEKVWYTDLFIGKESLPVRTSLHVDEFVKTLLNN
ncbi:hypothetical protein [Staphylococcus simulans]|uniref:hypothetical protein n=1 Tax=Staphylococcus simulans TaxID=1286 RepID=UPI000D1D8FD6|nr:hypothetical protein [Staphylococcus simulans]PTJ09091.1 hypothetical protein BU044_11185 [Staphylococcus simulans]PTJ38166.1 hypothetical protein BU021_11680 [Staphylococcus simulans]